jgi:hypothetical protein
LIFDFGTGWFLDFHFLIAIIGMQISMMQTQMIATIQVVLKRMVSYFITKIVLMYCEIKLF